MECPICLEVLKNKFICKTPCGHDFCLKCILNLNEFKCPICRQLFTNSLPDKLLPVLENNMNGTPRTNSSVNRYNEIDFPPLR